jgi:galactose-1-phosphate uridylyltransferase
VIINTGIVSSDDDTARVTNCSSRATPYGVTQYSQHSHIQVTVKSKYKKCYFCKKNMRKKPAEQWYKMPFRSLVQTEKEATVGIMIPDKRIYTLLSVIA